MIMYSSLCIYISLWVENPIPEHLFIICVRVRGKRVSAPLRMKDLFQVHQGIIRKGGSRKQEHTGTQTWGTNDKGDSDENQTCSVT